MVGQAPIAFIPEGASTNKPSGFNGKYLYYWKGKMKLFLESQYRYLWDIIKICPQKPKKRNQARVEIDKPKER